MIALPLFPSGWVLMGVARLAWSVESKRLPLALYKNRKRGQCVK